MPAHEWKELRERFLLTESALWQFALHDFWCQVAIVAVLKVLWATERLRYEVCPITPPWEHPPWR